MQNSKFKIACLRRQENSRGGYAAMVTTLLIVAVSLTIIGGFVFFALREAGINRLYMRSVESRYISESGLEDAVYRLVSGKQISSGEILPVGNGDATITIITNGNQKTVRSEGLRQNFQQNLETFLDISVQGVSFNYGVQVGEGGLQMDNSSVVTGNVYSNGSITGGNGATIVGDVIVATGIADDPTLFWDTNNSTFNFATTSSSRDIAQSFTATANGVLNKVSVHLGKNGSPSDITLRIVPDNAGNPDRTDLAEADISASSVGINSSWIDVPLASPPNLVNGTKYWIVLDYGSNSTTNNWKWSMDNTDGYAANTGKYVADWNSPSASWRNTNGDLNFRAWIGGDSNEINNVTIGNVLSGQAYADLFVDTEVHGSNCPNQYCITNDPQPQAALPISDGLIQDFKDEASTGDPIIGDYIVNSDITLGPKEITGDLIFGNTGIDITINGTVYVHGNIDFSKTGLTIECAAGYGENSCVMLSDGWIHVKNGAAFDGSGQSGSFIMIMSDSPCIGVAAPPCDTAPDNGAIRIDNTAIGAIFYASDGMLTLDNGVNISEATAYKLHLNQNANVTYDQGLADTKFTSGPSGGYNILYWKEVE